MGVLNPEGSTGETLESVAVLHLLHVRCVLTIVLRHRVWCIPDIHLPLMYELVYAEIDNI
jgi:hypothetical protein